MQALSIYVLIRLDEGETDHNNHDFLLMATVIVSRGHTVLTPSPNFKLQVIAQQLTLVEFTPASSSYSLKNSWKDWIFEESRRRSDSLPSCTVPKVKSLTISKIMRDLQSREHASLFRASSTLRYENRARSSTTASEKTAMGSKGRNSMENGNREGTRSSE